MAAASKAELLKRLRRKRASVDDATKTVDALREGGHFDGPRGFATAITACRTGDKWQLAVALIDEMHRSNLQPTSRAYSAAISVCEANDQPLEVERLKVEAAMVESVAAPAEAAQAEAARSLAKAASPPASAFERATGPDGEVVRYSRGTLCQRLRRRDFEPAQHAPTIAMLREDGHLDALEGYVAALRSIEFGEQWEWALELLGELRSQEGFDMNDEQALVAHNVAINTLARCLQWSEAIATFEEMREKDVQPDAETFQAVVSACSRSGQWEPALALLAEAQECGKADAETHSIGMMACASSEAWQAAVALLESTQRSPVKDFSRDLAYGIAIFGCMQAGQWERCLAFLQDMTAQQITPDATAYSCTHTACKDAKKLEAAKGVLAEMKSRRVADKVNDVMEESTWVLEGPEMRSPVPLSALEPMASKEVSLFKFVKRRAEIGNVDSVIQTIESFAQQRQWLKIQGEDKKEILDRTLRPTDRVVEMGCYVGYSSMCMAKTLREMGGKGSVTTLEVDAAVGYIARAMHQLAGVEHEVQVRIGCASDWVATGQLGTIDFLLMDHRGTIYHEDLHAAEPILSDHAIVFADNVLYPGAPLFLHYIDVMGYQIEIHELKEFLRPDLDDWVVICRPPPKEKRGPMPRETPAEMRRLSAEVDAISWKSMSGPVDWVGFQERLKPVFYKWKEDRGL